jgi:hypothetical protein
MRFEVLPAMLMLHFSLSVICTDLSILKSTRHNILGDSNIKESKKRIKYRVIHKSVKHFKNSQQIDSAIDYGNSYADRERKSPSLFYIFHRCSLCPPLVIWQTSMR